MKSIKHFVIPFFVVVFLSSTVLVSNSSAQKVVNFGSTFGVNFAKWAGDVDAFANDLNHELAGLGLYGYDFEPISRKCITFGFYFEHSLIEKLLIRAELNLSQRGTKYKHDGLITLTDGYQTMTVNAEQKMVMQLDYLELPILVRYNFVTSKKGISPYAVGGPVVGWLINSKMKIKTTVEGETDTDTEKLDEFNKFDVGLYGGIGIAFTNAFLLEFRYNHNFISLFEDQDMNGYDMKNTMFSVLMLINWVD